MPIIPALPPKTFKEMVEGKTAQLVDTRTMLAFGGGHIDGALNIAASPILSIWAGWLLDPERPILLVLENDADAEKVAQLFVRTGYTKFAGYLVGGMRAWQNAGYPLRELPQMTIHELQNSRNGLQVVDVRGPAEWKNGRIPGATHIFLPHLQKRSGELDRDAPGAGLLRDRISRESRREPAPAGGLCRCSESAGKSPRLESGQVSGGKITGRIFLFLSLFGSKQSALICEICGRK